MKLQHYRIRILFSTVVVLAALAVGSLALVSAQEAELPAFTLALTEDGLSVPETAPAGLVAASFANTTEEAPLSIILARLKEAVTMDDLLAAMMEGGPEGMLPLVTLLGGSDVVPGATLEATFNLQPGVHVVLNLAAEIPDIVPFTVEETDSAADEVEMPVADVGLILLDFAFGMPIEVEAGPKMWLIENKGMQWHETFIVRLAEGTTQDDLMALLMAQMQAGESEGAEAPAEDAAPPFEDVFFWMPMDSGERAWTTLDLEPGTYAALCFLPDFETGQSHLEHGMIQLFEVTEAE